MADLVAAAGTRSCRACAHQDGLVCSVWGMAIPLDAVAAGCDAHFAVIVAGGKP